MNSPEATSPETLTSAETLWDQINEKRGSSRVALETWEGDQFERITWDDWRRDVLRAAGALRQSGVEPGSRVACMLTNSYSTICGLLGAWFAGAAVVSMPTPARGMAPEHYQRQLRKICADVEAELILAEGQFVDLLAGAKPDHVAVRGFDSLHDGPAAEPNPPVGEDLAFVQYSSGSTGDPRGCMLSARAVAEQVELLGRALGVTPEDQGMTWLPLSHDMGLFGALMQAWRWDLPLRVGTPQRFLRSPRSWMQDLADCQATMAVAPDFALALAARAARVSLPERGFPLRSCIIGGELVSWETLRAATDVLGPCGFTLPAMSPAYGLAEATLAVTMTPDGQIPRTLTVDREALLEGELVEGAHLGQRGMQVVSCGAPIEGIEVRIAGGDVGRVCITSPSGASGYVNDPAATERTFVNGELHTNDLGFIRDGELYIVGRADDVLCVGGRNVHASEIEKALGAAGSGVRPGCCVLVDVPDTSGGGHLVLLAEPARDLEDLHAATHRIQRTALGRAGVRINEVVFVSAGTLPKTPSGKVQRFRARHLATEDSDRVIARLR